MVEAPLLVRPYIERMTHSELFAVMATGMATVAGSVMVAYAGMLGADYAGHLLDREPARRAGRPAAREGDGARDGGAADAGRPAARRCEEAAANVFDAAAIGAIAGLRLAGYVGALLIAFVALVALANDGTRRARRAGGHRGPELPGTARDRVRAARVADGRSAGGEATKVGALLGVKTVLNEFIAYQDLAVLVEGRRDLAPRGGARVLRALRLRELRVAGDPARRPRRDGAVAARRDRAAGLRSILGRHARDADGGVLGGHLPVSRAPQRRAAEAAPLEAVDRLLLAYLAGLAALALVYVPRPAWLAAGIAAVAIALVGCARSHSHSRLGRWAHDFFPIVGVVACFNLSGPVIAAANATRWDATFASWDRALFGALPVVWVGLLGRPAWLTDAASIVYCSYYVIPVAMGVALYRADRRSEFDAMVFAVVATFLVSYVCYFAAPALGPRVPSGQAARVLGGGATSESIRWFLHRFEGNELDAFPSGHTALSLVFLGFGWRIFPRWRVPLAALVAGIVFSTVYLSLHYVVDVLAGALLAAGMPLLLPPLRRIAAPRRLSDRR